MAAARVGFSCREDGEEGAGALGVTGFNLQSALESGDIVDVKDHVRSLHHLVSLGGRGGGIGRDGWNPRGGR